MNLSVVNHESLGKHEWLKIDGKGLTNSMRYYILCKNNKNVHKNVVKWSYFGVIKFVDILANKIHDDLVRIRLKKTY